jgi:hypothetical protein
MLQFAEFKLILIPQSSVSMTKHSLDEVTQLLQAWSEGNLEALDKLVPLVHAELHRLARHYMSNERPGHTLQTT